MDNIRCSNCSLLNFATATACKRCGLPLDSASGNEWEAHAQSPSEAYSQPTERDPQLWDRPSYRPSYTPAPVASSSVAPTLVKIFVTLAVVALVAYLAIPMLLKRKSADFSKITWSEFQSPDGKCSVSLPIAPKQTTIPQMTPFGNVQVNMIEARVNNEGGCLLAYVDYQAERLNMSEEQLYDLAIKGAASRQKSLAIGARRYVTLNGYRGIEVQLTPTDSDVRMSGMGRIFWVSPRLYVVMGAGPDTADFRAVQARCLDSFKILKR